jgi:hypothetical protein
MERLRALVDSFRDTVALNDSSLDIKKKEPSRRATLTSVSEVVAQIENLVGEANSLIQAHNKLVANRESKRRMGGVLEMPMKPNRVLSAA